MQNYKKPKKKDLKSFQILLGQSLAQFSMYPPGYAEL
jgi:hypothetical protein